MNRDQLENVVWRNAPALVEPAVPLADRHEAIDLILDAADQYAGPPATAAPPPLMDMTPVIAARLAVAKYDRLVENSATPLAAQLRLHLDELAECARLLVGEAQRMLGVRP